MGIEPGLVSGRLVPVDDAMGYGAVKNGYSRDVRCARLLMVAGTDRGDCSLKCGAHC